MATLTIVPKTAPGSVTVEEIPDEFKNDFELAWTALQENPGTELKVEFEDEAERAQWLTYARSYGTQRTKLGDDTVIERVNVRALPKRNLPKTIAYVTFTLDIPANGAANTHRPSEAEGRRLTAK